MEVETVTADCAQDAMPNIPITDTGNIHSAVTARPSSVTNIPVVLILFSGQLRPDGTSLEECLTKLGIGSVTFDILYGPHCDLADDAIWQPLVSRIKSGDFMALMAGPPCGTFSASDLFQAGPHPCADS